MTGSVTSIAHLPGGRVGTETAKMYSHVHDMIHLKDKVNVVDILKSIYDSLSTGTSNLIRKSKY